MKNTSSQITGIKKIRLQISKWLKKRFVLGRYSYSYKSTFSALLTFLALVAVFYYATFQSVKNRTDSNTATQKEIKSITERIGKFMELPQGETPTLATVSDREKLKDQQFFLNTKNGDKVLLYPKAKKAILYRPASGKIIEVANLTSGSHVGSAAPEPANNSSN